MLRPRRDRTAPPPRGERPGFGCTATLAPPAGSAAHGTVSASLDGVQLGSANLDADGFAIKMSLDAYVYAQVDNWQVTTINSN